MWSGHSLRDYELTPQEAFWHASAGKPLDATAPISKAVACEHQFTVFMAKARRTWAHMEVLRRLRNAADYYGQMAATAIEVSE